jgi:hypothetical protein
MKKKLTKTFHHIGLPTEEKQPGEYYVEESKVWVSDPRRHPYRIEFVRFAPDCPAHGPVRDQPHVAYRVNDLEEALRGEEILVPPFKPSPGLTVAFVLKDGAVVEYMSFQDDRDLPWK